GTQPDEILYWLINCPNRPIWSEAIYQFLLSDQAYAFTSADQKALRASNGIHPNLSLLLAMIVKDEPFRLHSLAAMRTSDYRRVVQDLHEQWCMSDWQVFLPKHINDWLELCSDTCSRSDLIEGIKRVAKHGKYTELEQVSAIIHRLNTETNREIWRWLQSSR